MNNEKGPHYEMPKGVSLEYFDRLTFEDNKVVFAEEQKLNKSNKKSSEIQHEKIKSDKVNSRVKDISADSNKKHKFIIPVIIAGVVLVAVIAVLIIHLTDNNRKILQDLDDRDKVVTLTRDDLNITFYGYDGTGRVYIELDTDSIVPKILECMDVDVNDPGLAKEAQARRLCNEYSAFVVFNELSDGEYNDGFNSHGTDSHNLYNGQKFEVLLQHESELKEYGEQETVSKDIVLQLEKTIIECEGLEEISEIDVFEDVVVIFSGEDGNLTAKCVYIGEISSVSSGDFYIDVDNGNFSYGDEVWVNIKDTSIERLYSQEGIILQRESCIYTAEPKSEVVIKLRDITDENMSYMIDAGIEKVSDWAENSSTKIVYTGMEYYGAYLYSASKYDDKSVGIYNKLIIVYTAYVYGGESMDSSYSVYLPVIFENIVNETDGTQTIGDNISFRSNLHKDDEWGTYVFGYNDKNELSNAIKPYATSLTWDCTVELE